MNRIYLTFLLNIFLISVIPIEVQCQSSSCGTYITLKQKNLESSISITEGSSTESIPQLNRTLSIHVYIVKNDKYLPGVSSSEIQSAIDKLNTFFQPVSLQFKLCNTTYIDNYHFDNLSALNNEADLVSQFSEKNIINLYLVTALTDSLGMDASGYTYMPSTKKDYVFIRKSSLGGSSLAHQIGHFLNLYHTHETIFGNELVNRSSNCSTAGDKCCDTEADPNLAGLVDNTCVYTGKLKDSNGSYFQPKPKNIMSFGDESCRCSFSRSQFLRIIYALQNVKKDLR
jgi:hypothetical protein